MFPIKKRPQHKFHAKICEDDGIKFSSKAERAFYQRLKFEKQNGRVLFFLRQVPIELPGKTKYVVDFQVFYEDGTVAFIDVKGVETENFKLKKRQVEALYPFEIEIFKC
jgi:Holliday junction resolvase